MRVKAVLSTETTRSIHNELTEIRRVVVLSAVQTVRLEGKHRSLPGLWPPLAPTPPLMYVLRQPRPQLHLLSRLYVFLARR